MTKTQTVRVAIAAILAGLSMSTDAIADPARPIDVPAGELVVALETLSRQAAVDLVFQPDKLRSFRTEGVSGTYSPEDAIRILLKGTPFELRTDASSGAMVIARSADDAGPAAKVIELEEIVITGSRIRRNGNGPSQVYSFDREDFAAQGADTAQQVLRNLPQNFTGGASEQGAVLGSNRNGGSANLGYGAGVNLRGLGTESTLVLLNGHRLAPGGLGNYVDISTIPLSAIARIEVMPDGASAVYGSDAVGGVVNFILRDDFEGAETRVRYGSVTDGGLTQTSASQLLGLNWSSGSGLINFDYGKDEPLLGSERSYALGMQNGVTYLSPSTERKGVLINGHQELTATLGLSLHGYANQRDAASRSMARTTLRQSDFKGETEQLGGTLSLQQRVGETWALTLSQTEDRNDSRRINNLGATATLAANRTEVRTEHEVSATELEGEGALFALPAGQIRLAVGAERREESLQARRVNVAGSGPFAPLERDVTAGYAELFVPVLSEANAAAFAGRLDFTFAGRYEDYSDVGSSDTYKAGALWSPVKGVDVRASWGTSFRAPYLYQYDTSLSQGIVMSSTLLNPPVRLAYILNAPAPGLGPETAKTYTVGFDIDQDVLGVQLSASYFDIEYEDRIRAVLPTGNVFTDPVLSTLLSMPPDPEVLAAIAAATTITNVTGQPLSAAQAAFDARTRNQGLTKVSGIDLSLERELRTGLGSFKAGLNGNYLLEYELSTTDTAPLISILNTVYNPVDLRGRAYLTWARGGWSAAAFANYVDDYVDNQVIAAPVKISSWTTVDLNLGYRFDPKAGWLGGLSLRLNVANAFDKDPPRVNDRGVPYGNPGYDSENANPIGRLVALTVSKEW